MVPGWGGAVIENLPLDACQDGCTAFRLGKEELKGPMGLFAEQLRGLMGVQKVVIETDLLASPSSPLAALPLIHAAPSPNGITLLELDRLARVRCARNVLDAARSLASLGKLVSGIPSMPVPDRLASSVRLALRELRLSLTHSASGLLDPAFRASAEALRASEAAFFDPAAVSMLYFPDEHRYAVYMPFFVPVGVPLLVGLIGEGRRWLRGSKGKGKVE